MQLNTKIETANRKALDIITSSQPRWVDVRPAIDVIPGMKENLFLHAGPPIAWERMCGAQQKAVQGAAVYEGFAKTVDEAASMFQSGELTVEPCHEHATVGSMTGVTSASMPVMVVDNAPYGNLAFVNVHEGPSRQRLTYGAFNDAVLQNLIWIRDVLGPALAGAVHQLDGLDITPIVARALTMGDECHNRPAAGSALFTLRVMPHVIRSGLEKEESARVAEFLAATEHFFFHLAMAACKVAADAISGIPYCSVVTAMARNGIETGIRVSATGAQWFTGPASSIEGVYFPGYGPQDAEADLGDSAITETMGLGAFAMGASIPMAYAIGGTASDAIQYQESMADITVGRHAAYRVPALDFQGTPLGIDVRKVIETGTLPIIDTAIANKQGGEIGVGLARPPMACFVKSLKAFNHKVRTLNNSPRTTESR